MTVNLIYCNLCVCLEYECEDRSKSWNRTGYCLCGVQEVSIVTNGSLPLITGPHTHTHLHSVPVCSVTFNTASFSTLFWRPRPLWIYVYVCLNLPRGKQELNISYLPLRLDVGYFKWQLLVLWSNNKIMSVPVIDIQQVGMLTHSLPNQLPTLSNGFSPHCSLDLSPLQTGNTANSLRTKGHIVLFQFPIVAYTCLGCSYPKNPVICAWLSMRGPLIYLASRVLASRKVQ